MMFTDWPHEMLYEYECAIKKGDKEKARKINRKLRDNGFYIRQTGVREYTVGKMIRKEGE